MQGINPTSSPAHLFAIRERRKRGWGYIFKNCSGKKVGDKSIPDDSKDWNFLTRKLC